MKERKDKDARPGKTPAAETGTEPLHEYARLVSGLTHDFRTPLGSIVGAASVLESYGDGMDEDMRARLCTGIMDQAHRLDRLLTTLATIGRARSGGLGGEARKFEFNELLHGLSTRMRDNEGVPVEVSVLPGEVFLEADPAVTQNTLSLMLYLAFDHAPDGGKVQLSLAADGKSVSVTVESGVREDGGKLAKLVGMDADELLSGRRATAGAVYLAAIRDVVHILGGDLSITHEEAVSRLCQTVRLPAWNV